MKQIYQEDEYKIMRYLVLILSLIFHLNSRAGEAQTTMDVSATVLKICNATATPLFFGDYINRDLTGAITVTINCTPGTRYFVGVKQTEYGNKLKLSDKSNNNNSNQLSYIFYQDAAMTRVLGNIPGRNTISGVQNENVDTITIYGIIQGEQYADPGLYMDQIEIVVSF